MNERVLAKNKTSATPPQATQASSPLLHRRPLTEEQSESLGSNSNISKELGGIQPKTIRRSLNWQNISVEAPSRGNGMSLPGGIQRQQEEPGAVIGDRVSADTAQKSALELSNSTISTEAPAQKPSIARAPFNRRNIPIEAPPRSAASNTYPGGIQRLETSGVKEQEESTESLQMQPDEAIQAKSSEGEPQEKEEPNKELVQTKLTVGAPGDKYEQEADSMAAKVMRMPDSAIKPPIQRQTGEETEAVQMQPLVNSITPLVQRLSGEQEEVQMKSGAGRASDGSSVASGSVENRLAGSKGGGSPLPNDVRSFMESRFGADFSSVRVHTDSNAVQMNKELGAQAFAHGSDIYYGAGKSPGKDELTAHELTHIIQQGGAVPTKSVTGHQKKENKLQAKADAIQLTSVEAKVQRKENPQAQPAAAKVAPQTPAASPSAKSEKGERANTIEKPAPGNGAGAPSTPAGGGGAGAGASSGAGAGASSGGAAGGGGGGGGNSPKSAQNDPGFKAVVNSTKSVAAQEKNHPPAGKKSAEAQAAAVSPANEVESKAQDKQVQEMNQQQPGQFNAGAFKAALMEKISAATPQTLEEADNFKDQNKLDSVKGDLSSQVGEEKKQAANPIEEKAKEQPDASGIPPKSVTALPPKQAGKAPSDIGADKAAPKPKSKSEVSLQAGSKSIDKQMADANITDRQLAKSNEPQFQTALESKKTAQTHANTAPNAYRQQEQGIVTQAQAQAQTTAQAQLQGMHGEREQLLTQVVGLQTDTKGQDEQKRSQVANHIQGIYNNTKQKVETALSQLDGEVNQQFDSGAATAKTQFESYVDQRMKRYKDDRYSGLAGKGQWVIDLVLPLPSEVNAFYEEGKGMFLASMGQTIDIIANKVATKLNAAKAEIAKGRQEIQKYVASLDPSLRQVGQEAAQNIGAKFDELEQSVENKQNELIDSLAQKYNENLQVLDTQINEMKAENRGLMNKAMDAMGGTIKIILEMKNLLMGVLAKAGGAVDKIILDPIGFLGNLVGGLKQGFQNFQSNSEQHLQKGMVGWLTGTLASTGVQMPESFDMKGIFSLTTQVLGTTYQAIRPRAVKAIGKNGEESVSALESNFEMFVILKNEGVGGLWQFIQDKIGDLKSMVIDTIKSFVIETVIKQGIMWILSLLNPASAFVRACKAIIDIITFFIQRGSQIVELVNAVIESVTAIANGAVGGAAKAIENAMSKALPVIIGFMASLLGLGGITGKIQDIIKRVRGPIEKAIDWVIAQAVKFAKKIGNKLGFGKNKKSNKDDGNPDERTKEEKEADLEKALKKSEQIMREKGATPDTVKAKLPAIQSKYKLTSLELVKTRDTIYHVEGKVNPENETPDITLSEADEDWEKAWRAKQEEVQSKMQQFVPRFQALDPNAEVHVKGSLASGVKLNPKKRSPSGEPYVFNPTDFDIDAYVKSNALYKQALQKGAVLRKPGEIVGSKSNIPGFNQIIWDMRKELAKISGNRDVGDEMFRFNVFIRTDQNASSSIERDQKLAKNINQDASIGNPLIIKDPNKE
ncbi:eCIS core domain-containing protein [Microcoleus vaginatus]|uniref:eCIS core domain-containing protein n=1 Tax=Microcoleus vaginatus TaxID=119532 RepID=UPI0032A892C2